ncbi:MAG: MAPEG family protein [Pseudomonadota bacterium]
MGSFAITALYGGLLAIVLIILSVRVVFVVRLGRQVSLGDGDAQNLPTLRAQGNFIEYVPFAIVLLGIAEFHGTSPTWIHTLGAILLIARILHPFGLSTIAKLNVLRILGMAGTWTVLGVSAILCIRIFFGQ